MLATRLSSLVLLACWLVLSPAEAGIAVSQEARELVVKACAKKLDFRTIAEFNSFIEAFKALPKEASDTKTPAGLAKCLAERDAILALHELVRGYEKLRPCKYSEIGKLEAFARKYLHEPKPRPIVLSFFTLFGVNIGFVCKLNLLAHMKQAEIEADQVDFVHALASPVGWDVLLNEMTKKAMKFGGSSEASNSIVNRVARLIPGLVQVDELNYLDFSQASNQAGEKRLVNGVELDEFKTATSLSARELFHATQKIIAACQRLDQLYVNSILSLGRLNHLGLLVGFDVLADMHGNSLILHKWLAAASFCQVMARVAVEHTEPSATLKLKIVHDDTQLQSRRTLYSYVAKFDEITEQARQNVWLASVFKASWRQEVAAMFSSTSDDVKSAAMKQVLQFMRGLENDNQSARAAHE